MPQAGGRLAEAGYYPVTPSIEDVSRRMTDFTSRMLALAKQAGVVPQ